MAAVGTRRPSGQDAAQGARRRPALSLGRQGLGDSEAAADGHGAESAQPSHAKQCGRGPCAQVLMQNADVELSSLLPRAAPADEGQ